MDDHTGGTDWIAAERAGFIAAVASAGATFDRSLVPRSTVDQAIATGLISALNYGIVQCSQGTLRTIAHVAAGRRDSTPAAARRVVYLAHAGGIGLGLLTQLPRQPERPALTSVGRRLARSSALGLTTAVAVDLSGLLDGRVPAALLPAGRLVTAAVGAGIAAAAVRNRTGPPPSSSGRTRSVHSVALGSAISVGLVALAKISGAVARTMSSGLESAGLPRRAAALAGHGAVLGGTIALVRTKVRGLMLASQAAGAQVEAERAEPPESDAVSGGRVSAVPFATLGLHGRRFVSESCVADDISAVMGGTAHTPVRVFVGLHSASTPAARAALALAELETLGAFSRRVLCLAVPAGTGHVNPVAIDALEHLTRGDCATVALQYSLRKSFYSLNRVEIACEQNRLLLEGIARRLQTMPVDQRPQLLLYGESLGARAAQQTLTAPGLAGLTDAGIDRALFVGTPRGSQWARHWRADPGGDDPGGRIVEVASYEEWVNVPADRRGAVRCTLLTHHDDPVAVFEYALVLRPPTTTSTAPTGSATNGTGSATNGTWRPMTTFVLTGLDLKNAMATDPGLFTDVAHDYRADMARMIAAAYALPCDDDQCKRLEQALRRRRVQVGH